jgi:hypothetical protein
MKSNRSTYNYEFCTTNPQQNDLQQSLRVRDAIRNLEEQQQRRGKKPTNEEILLSRLSVGILSSNIVARISGHDFFFQR